MADTDELDLSPGLPDWHDVPEDDDAEPVDADTDHVDDEPGDDA